MTIDSKLVQESMATAKFGMVAQWMTPDGPDIGVVVGDDDRDVLAVTAFPKSDKNDVGNKKFRDDDLSAKLHDLRGLKGVQYDVHRIPKPLATLIGKIKGHMLQRYQKVADLVNTAPTAKESLETASAILGEMRKTSRDR